MSQDPQLIDVLFNNKPCGDHVTRLVTVDVCGGRGARMSRGGGGCSMTVVLCME